MASTPDSVLPAPPELLEHLTRRFTFVVGKGGVGKSTSAVRVALALADAGHRTHLLSTDPAHSLGDLFDHPFREGEPVSLPGCPLLVVEELDARGRGQAWLQGLTEGVGELAELGTYLDAEDVVALIEPALPGLGEVVATLRLTELEEGDADRIVVDTAPTGHTLRLLDCGRLLEGWAEALDAMAAKAGAIQERFLRQRVRFRGEAILDEMRDRAARFETMILPASDFLLISRPEPLVRAETDRLGERLAEEGCHVALRLEVEVPAEADPTAPERSGGVTGARTRGEDGAGRPDDSERLLERLGGRSLLLFAGKGGVGKSTCAAACAVALARHRPVTLLGTDPAGSFEELLGSTATGAGSFPARLRIRQTEPESEFHDFRRRYADEIRQAFGRLGLEHSVPLDRRVMESLLDLAPPGIDEIFALRALIQLAEPAEGKPEAGQEGEQGIVVVDTAPTGHFLRLMEMPEPALAWARAVMRLLVKYRAVLGLDQFAPGLLDFARALRALIALLGDPGRAGIVVVSLDEQVVRRETVRLLQTLEARGLPIALLLVNRHRSGSGLPKGGTGATDPRAMDVSIAVAPQLAEAPAGPRALDEFFHRWQIVP